LAVPNDDLNERLMRAALAEAQKAIAAGEVPVGAVVAVNDQIVGAGFNQPISANDPTAHAEVVALRAAAKAIGNYRLTGATLCVTVEPCVMCVGAIVHARIGTLIFGALESKTGAVRSTLRLLDEPCFNHRVSVIEGVMEEACRTLMQGFFQTKRAETKEQRGGSR
jgi:tRNA(adenine34) deaminase